MGRAFKLLDGLLVLAGVALLAIALFVATTREITGGLNPAFVILPVLAAAGIFASFLLAPQTRANLALALGSTALTVYALEVFVALDPMQLFGETDQDRPTRATYARQLQEEGVDAYPVVGSRTWADLSLQLDGSSVVPLSGIPNTLAVMCHENAGWVTYQTDRFGFNNDDAVWQEPLQVALIGDSFVEGWCVERQHSFAGRIGAAQEGVVNTGLSGHGPLIQLGVLREFVADLRPEHVIWFFFEGNDLTEDLPWELANPTLRSYLQSGGGQGLAERADRLREAMRTALQAQLWEAAEAVDASAQPSLVHRMTGLLKLRGIRSLLGLRFAEEAQTPASSDEPPLQELAAILEQGRREVQGWGGTLHFVYLPDFPSASGTEWPHRAAVLRAVRDLELPTIDVTEAFRTHAEPASLFSLETDGVFGPTRAQHYNEAGHQLVAERVLEVLGQR